MIHVEDLRVDYDNFCAVKKITFDVQPGHVYGLIGPNGSGKTTTMKAILGLLEPTYGRINVCGVDVRENPEEGARRIGFMPDFPPIYEDLHVWEFLDLFAASYYVPKSERMEIIERYLHLVNLTEKRNSFIPGLSRGMRQRVMLAKTLIPDPDVIILDEPASGLDPNARIDLKNVIKNLAARGKSVLVSSHILSEMNEFCTAIGIMEKGRMVETGTIADIERRVMGAAPIFVELLHPEQEEGFRAFLARKDSAGKLSKIGESRFEFPYEGEEEESAELLRELVNANIMLTTFGRKKEGLEEIFLKVGAKGIQQTVPTLAPDDIAMNEMLRLADNPIFVKHLRSRLRKSAVVSGLVVVFFLCICICFFDYMQREKFKQFNNPADVYAGLWMLVMMQGIILNLMGGAQVAQSISYVKDSGILDYHRITPLPSRVQTIGFLAGAPIREYIFYIATLPFMLALALVSNAGIGGFSKIVLVQVGFAAFSHALGLLVGLTSKSSKGASGRYVAIIIGLAIFSNSMRWMGSFGNERYYGPSLLSTFPVIGEVLEPHFNQAVNARQQAQINQQLQAPMQQMQQKNKQFVNKGFVQPPVNVNIQQLPAPPEAKFLGIEVPLVLQTLLVQGMLIVFIFIGCSRRIRSSRIPIYNKAHAVGFFSTLCFLALATLWGLKQDFVLGINVYALTFFGCILLGMSTQSAGEINKGYQRAARLGRKSLSPWNDLSSNHLTVLLFVAVFAAFAAIDYYVMTNGPLLFNGVPIEAFVPMFAVAIGTLLVAGFLVQSFYLKYDRKPGARLGLFIFFAWIAPLIVGGLLSARHVDEAAYLFAVSPITAIGGVINPRVFQAFQAGPDITDSFRTVAYVSLATQAVLFLVLSHGRERRLRDSVHAERREDDYLDTVKGLPATD